MRRVAHRHMLRKERERSIFGQLRSHSNYHANEYQVWHIFFFRWFAWPSDEWIGLFYSIWTALFGLYFYFILSSRSMPNQLFKFIPVEMSCAAKLFLFCFVFHSSFDACIARGPKSYFRWMDLETTWMRAGKRMSNFLRGALTSLTGKGRKRESEWVTRVTVKLYILLIFFFGPICSVCRALCSHVCVCPGQESGR